MSSRDPNMRNTGPTATPAGNGEHSHDGDVVVGREVTYGATQDTGVKQKAKEAVSKAGESVRDVAETAGETARSTFASQKSNAASMLGSVAHALHETGNQLRNEDQQNIARMADQVADQVQRFGSSIQDADLDQVMHNVREFARNRPEIFLGAAFTLGLLAARFLKSSGQRASEIEMRERPYPGTRSAYSTDLGTGYGGQPGASTMSGYGGTLPDEP
ncbi:MAG: hypothetical protein ACYC4R_01735 [Anaerolineae bacterium]